MGKSSGPMQPPQNMQRGYQQMLPATTSAAIQPSGPQQQQMQNPYGWGGGMSQSPQAWLQQLAPALKGMQMGSPYGMKGASPYGMYGGGTQNPYSMNMAMGQSPTGIFQNQANSPYGMSGSIMGAM